VPPPPRDLSREAARLWRNIAGSRPIGWFTPATLRLLRRYCRTALTIETLHDALDDAVIGSDEHALIFKQVIAGNASLGILAAKMRLSTQAEIGPRSGQLNESGMPDDPLLGGRAVVRFQGRVR
jgi:hypothetical protein